MKLKLSPILALAVPALAFAAKANIRGNQESSISIRKLSSDYSTTDYDYTDYDDSPLSAAELVLYTFLNAVLMSVDMSGHGCNKHHKSSSHSSGHSTGWSSGSDWAGDAHTWGSGGSRKLEWSNGNDAWGGGNSQTWSSGTWSSSHSGSSSSKKKPHPHHKPHPPPRRCKALHAPHPHPPHPPHPRKKSGGGGGSSHSWTGDSWTGDSWTSGGDSWGGDSHGWSNDGHYDGSASWAFVGGVVGISSLAAGLFAKKKGYCKSKEGIFFPSQLNKDADTIAETVDDDTCDGTNDLDANADYLEMTDNGLKSPGPVEPAAAPTKTSKWRSAIDAATGRTYYYLKGTKMTSWVKPSGM